MINDMQQPVRVALALGSGGARGYAHIGAIQVLEERGYEIAAIAGSSMGALIGGLRAAGALDEYTDWVTGLTQFDVIRLLDPSRSAPGVIRAEKIFARVRDLIGDIQIEDLPIPFTAVATDLLAQREVWFQNGPLVRALRASISIPSIITPVMLNGRLLADGGVMNPVPVAPTLAVRTDITIAVDLGGDSEDTTERGPARETAADRPFEEWGERVRRSAARLLDRESVRSLRSRFGNSSAPDAPDGAAAASPPASPVEPDFDALPQGLSKFDVMNMSLQAMQSVLTRFRLVGYPPDIVVTIARDACGSLDFHRAEELIALGRRLTTEALDRADDRH
jgi:NTE family protein